MANTVGRTLCLYLAFLSALTSLFLFCCLIDLVCAGGSSAERAFVNAGGSFCSVLQTSLGDGPHETQGSAKLRFRLDFNLVPDKLTFTVRFPNAAGEYFLGPGQLYPVNNIAVDKPSGSFFSSGNALMDYIYISWRPRIDFECALGVFEPWTYEMGTREGISSFLNGISDCGDYLHNLHFFQLAGFKPTAINLFRSLPTFAIRYDPLKNFRVRGFAMTTQVEKWGLFNPEWELSKHLPDYTSYFFEVEYRGDIFGRAASYRIDFGWVDVMHVKGLNDPGTWGFNWGIVASQRLFSDHFSVNAFYYHSDDRLANKLVSFVEEEGSFILTLAWGGNSSPESRFYNYLCKYLIHFGLSKARAYGESFVPVDFGYLKSLTPIKRDEYVFEAVYIQRLQHGFAVNAGMQAIKNPGAGHEDWMFVPEIGITLKF